MRHVAYTAETGGTSRVRVDGLKWCVSGQRAVAVSLKHGNEPSGCIKCGEFPDELKNSLCSQEKLFSMALVRELVTINVS